MLEIFGLKKNLGLDPGPDAAKSLGSGPAFSDSGIAILLQVYKQNYFSVYHRRI
jgi:hypothetical protein